MLPQLFNTDLKTMSPYELCPVLYLKNWAGLTRSGHSLHHLIRENYRQVFFNKEIHGAHLPFHFEREFKKYLTCGNLAFGMARFHCSLGQKDKLLAFSCKGRTLCPSCTGRRMSDTAKHLIEEVIPEVATRQWVLSMP